MDSIYWWLPSIIQVYAKVSGEPSLEVPTVDVSSKEFYGEGYDDSDKRIPDMTIINKQLGNDLFSLSFLLCSFAVGVKFWHNFWMELPGWNPKTSLWDLLESTLTYQHRTYAEAIKQAIAKPVAS